MKETPRDQWVRKTVAQTMTPLNDTLTVSSETPMTEVLVKMEASGLRRVLVTSDEQLLGIITSSDLSSWLQRMQELS